MNERTFIDTNVLVYADDASAGRKRKRAREAIADAMTGGAVISTQVLQEYFVAATRKLGLSTDAARRRIETLSGLDVVVIRTELILAAIDLHRLRSISFWDALVVRSAAAAGCRRLLTEDLAEGEVMDGVRIENPFR